MGMDGVSDGVKQTPLLLPSGWCCHLHTRCRIGAGYVTKVHVVTSSWVLGGMEEEAQRPLPGTGTRREHNATDAG